MKYQLTGFISVPLGIVIFSPGKVMKYQLSGFISVPLGIVR